MEQETIASQPSKAPAKQKLTKCFDMLEESCRVYGQNFKKFISIYLRTLLWFIPLFASIIIFAIFAATGLADNALVKAILSFIVFVSVLCAVYFGVRMRAAMILLIKNDYKSAKESFVASRKYFWGYVWVSIITTVIVGLWSLLLIIPGVIFAVYYMLANYTFFMEDKKGMMALRRSKELVKGYWGEVLGRSAFIGLAAAIISFIMNFPMSFLKEASIEYILYNIFTNAIWALLAPIIIIYTYYIFRDLVKIKGASKLN